MVLPLLLPLLASLQSLPRPVTPADPLLDPTLSMRDSNLVYPPGEQVTLMCSPPHGEQSGGYRFFFQKGPHGPSTLLKESLESQLKFRAERGRSGSYTCAYWRWGSKGTKAFRSSSSISITVTAPQLSVSPPQPVYIAGEVVTLTCSVAGTPAVSGIRFFRDGWEIHSKKLTPLWDSYNHSLPLSDLSGAQARVYSCEFWKTVSGRELLSETSNPISITVTDPLPAPRLTVSPQQPVYITGETVTLMCSAAGVPTMSRIRFFKDSQEIHSRELPSPWNSYNHSLTLPGVSGSQAEAYSCAYWKTESGREIPSGTSQPISIAVTDPPPQPLLSVDPPSAAVSEGLPLLLTCAAPGNASQRRFHFYKDGSEIILRDLESEISTSEPSTSSVNVSVLSIPRAGPNISGEFACGYEENVSGRWFPSPRSQAMNVTVTASHRTRDTLLTTGGILLVASVLAALICCCRRKKRVPKPLKSTEESEPEEHTRNLDLSHNKTAKAMGAGKQQMEQDSEVTYAVIAPAALKAHTAWSKTKSMPDEEEHVLYSEVVTKHTWKADH